MVKFGNAVADEDVGIQDAQRHGLHFEVGQCGPVAGELQVRGQAGGCERQGGGGESSIAEAGACIHGNALALALLKRKGTLHIHKFADLNGSFFNVHAHERAVECQCNGHPTGGHRQACGAEGGLEVHEGIDFGFLPGVALVGCHANAVGFECEEVQANEADLVDCGRERPQVRHIAAFVAVEHQREVEVVHHEAGGVIRGFVVRSDLAVTVAVEKVRTGTDKKHGIREAHRDCLHRHVFNARVIGGVQQSTLHQALQLGSGVGRQGAEAGDDVHGSARRAGN